MRHTDFLRFWALALLAACLLTTGTQRSWAAGATVPAQPVKELPAFAPMYPDASEFKAAIDKERPQVLPVTRLTGITVPHHLLAADLIARGFWAASASQPRLVVVISPDHFHKTGHTLATTRRPFCTALGCLKPASAAIDALLHHRKLVEASDLFEKEHGIAALLPFIAHFFPKAQVLPIVVSVESHRAAWDQAVAILRPLLGPDTLIIQSTDFSHYLPLNASLLRDQETLNVLAARDAEAVPALRQSDHMDSKAAQYIQLRLQASLHAIGPIVVASRNAYEYRPSGGATTYVVELYAATEPRPEELRYADQQVYFLGGDVLLGRNFTKPLLTPAARQAIIEKIKSVTGGAPMLVNLEGFVLNEKPVGLRPQAHLMYEGLAIPFLKDIHVVAAGLANNHSFDVGQVGLDETVRALSRAGIVPIRHGEIADLGAFRVLALNYVSKGTIPDFPMVRTGDLPGLCQQPAQPPLVAFVHWGEEFTTAPRALERAQAAVLADCGISAVVGAHSHQASGRIFQLAGGGQQLTYSLGNFLFDQHSPVGSGALLELRLFQQGTYATRLIPIPNLFDVGNAVVAQQRK